jgi:hypothetical protein
MDLRKRKKMNHWLFTVTQKKTDSGMLDAHQILKQRLDDMFWGLGERTPNRRYLKAGDQVVFYVGIPHMVFAASAILSSDSFALSEVQKSQYDHGNPLYRAEYGVLLRDIQRWDSPRLVKDLVPSAVT